MILHGKLYQLSVIFAKYRFWQREIIIIKLVIEKEIYAVVLNYRTNLNK